MNSSQYYDLASLAEASYVLFEQMKADETLEFALTNKELEGNFSATQVADFVQEWSVAAYQPNTASGFSATLFQNANGSYFYAIRGTEQPIEDLLVTDGMDIATDGLAIDQIADMYNDWMRRAATSRAE